MTKRRQRTNLQDNGTRSTQSRRIDEGGDEPQLTVYRWRQVSTGDVWEPALFRTWISLARIIIFHLLSLLIPPFFLSSSFFLLPSSFFLTFSSLFLSRTKQQLQAGGKPSTWLPPGRLVEHYGFSKREVPSKAAANGRDFFLTFLG